MINFVNNKYKAEAAISSSMNYVCIFLQIFIHVQLHKIKITLLFRTNSLKRIKNAKWQVKDCPPELLLGDITRRLSTEVTPAAIAQNNRTFVEKLLKVILRRRTFAYVAMKPY